MSFFDGINTQESEFELGGGGFPPIEKDTRVLAVCESAVNESGEDFDTKEPTRYINLKWRISQPVQYQNRIIWQKLHVYDPKRADRHRSMLSAIAANAGGGLFTAMKNANESEPSDASLTQLTNIPMVLLLDVWNDRETGQPAGNWVKAVSPRKSQQQQAAAPQQPAPIVQQPAPAAAPAPASAPTADSFVDDIPF